MASSMVIPASKDTLFMRGFSSRQDIDGLRGFFSREGRCTVEFFKQSENKDKLYVALRFESKDIAKEILNKFDNKEVLGDRITISWFKDLRRARAQGRYRVADFNRHRWGGYYDRDQHYSYNRWHHSPIGSRSRRYDRSSSRSASRSHSRSASGSRSRSRSRDRHHHRSNSADSRESGKRSHSRSGCRSKHHKSSPAHDDSTDKEADQSSRGRTHKVTNNTSDDRSPSVEKKCSKDNNHDSNDRHAVCSRSSLDRASDGDNSVESSPPKCTKFLRSAVKTVEPPADSSGNNKVMDTASDQKLDCTTSYPHQQQRYQNARYYSEDSPPPEKATEVATKRRKDNRYNNDFNRCYEGYERTEADTADRTSYSPDHKRGSGKSQESETVAENPESPPPLSRDNRSSWRPDPRTDDHSSSTRRSYRSTSDGYGRERSPPDVMDDDSWRNKKHHQSVISDEEEDFDSQHRSIIDGETKKKRFIDDSLSAKELKRDHYDDRSCSSSRSSRGRDDTALPSGGESVPNTKKAASGMINNRFCREMEKGALGLSQDKMVLVREKKDEIEKAYRQDCETFAVVVKMLVSKDTKLEDQLQFSLRENLKDIGQRCIHELREFIEQLKSEEDMQL